MADSRQRQKAGITGALLRCLVLALTGVLTVVLVTAGNLAPASAHTPSGWKTASGPSTETSAVSVGIQAVSAGQCPDANSKSTTNVVATGVAANSGSALSRASEAAFQAADDPASIFVKNKHLASARGNGAKFATDDISQAQAWISRGLKSEGVQFLPNHLDDTFRAIVPGGGVAGTRGQEFIRVIVTGDGRVINAVPVHVR